MKREVLERQRQTSHRPYHTPFYSTFMNLELYIERWSFTLRSTSLLSPFFAGKTRGPECAAPHLASPCD